MKYDVVIVGAGLAGATVASVLAKHGYKVLVVEKEKHVAGQCFDYKNEAGITVHQYGPHIFHTNSKNVWNFVSQFSEFSNFQHHVLSYANGNLFEFPINRNTVQQVFGVNLSNEQIQDFLKSEVEKSTFNTPAQSYRDAVVAQVGETLYSLFFEQYTKKQWNTDPVNLSPDLASRIPVRTNNDARYFTDRYQGMPGMGYTKLVENMLNFSNIHLLMGCDYFELKDKFDAKLLVYTGLLDQFFDYKYGKLTYRSVRIDFKTYDQENFQSVPVVNYPNDYDWTRITEFKKMTGEKSMKTTVCFEYPLDEGHPFYVMPDKQNKEKRELYMNSVNELENTGAFLFVGRLAEYRYYNMDQVIEAALNKVSGWMQKFR